MARSKEFKEKPVCEAFELQPVPIPDGCGEVIALIKERFTTKAQWSYLRIYIELDER
jgi:hypothetical protein